MSTFEPTAIDHKTIGQLAADTIERVGKDLPGVRLWEEMMATAYGVQIEHELDNDEVTPYLDKIVIPLGIELGKVSVIRDEKDEDWFVYTDLVNGYAPSEMRFILPALARATEIAEWMNRARLPRENAA